MKIEVQIDLSKFMAYPKDGEQGYDIIITPRLGEHILTQNEATIIAEALTKMFKEEKK